jgi:phage FluMu protein Com
VKLTIDTGAIAHSIRRWLFKFLRTPRTIGRCRDCGKALTHLECNYYGSTCERCEGIAFHATELADRGATSCTNCHPNVAPEYRCTACPWKNAKPEIYLWAEDKDLLEALRASGVQQKGGA